MRRTRSPKPGTDAWTAQRRQAIFATDAAATAGLSRFSDPFTVYMEKLGLNAPKISLERMEWGKLLEPVIAKEWARRNGVKVTAAGHWTYWRDDLDFPMATHLDYTTPDGLLEVKTANAFAVKDFGEEGTDEVPMDYRLQCAHEMAVVGAARCHLVVLIGGGRLAHYVIERDPDLEAMLVEIEGRMWRSVESKTPPEIDGSEGASEYLRRTLATDDGSEIPLDEATAELALSYLAASEQEKNAEQHKKTIGNQIKEKLGSASVAKADDIQITFRQSKDSRDVAWESLARAYRRSLTAVRDVLGPHQAVMVGGELFAIDDKSLDAVESLYTTVKPGNRPLLVKIREP